MTMYHHDNRDFAEAKSDAARSMKEKLHREIEAHRAEGDLTLRKVLAEIPRDRYRMMTGTEFDLGDNHTLMVNYRGDKPEGVHPFALGKICETIGIPRDIIGRLMTRYDEEEKDNWGPELALDILNKHFKHQSTANDRRMIRSVKDQTRGFLSDSYARLHPGKLIETLANECQKYGLIPYGGHAGDTKFMVRATLDRILEPVKDEPLGIGIIFKESAFGDGASELSLYIERMWCTNKAIATSELRKVHLGAKANFDPDEADAAYQLATNNMCSEIKRSMRELLAPEAILQLTDTVRAANEANITHGQFEGFLKKHLNKNEVEKVKEMYRSANITDLPAGDTWWRASNALSWFANEQTDKEKAYDMQKLAGAALAIGARHAS